jgi:uncharacterized repeat protein (TIGR01451 family)
MGDRSDTNRWRGVLAVTLAAGALGLAANRANLLVLATVGVVFAAFSRATTPPSTTVDVERRVSDRAPSAGDDVSVTVTVTNTGSRFLPDVRVVDGVPSALRVVDGSPRHGTSLRAGEAATFSYTVATAAGRHHFEPTTVVLRDVSGATERTFTVATETEIDCSADTTGSPLRSQSIDAVGQIPSNVGGAGIEFHSTREYQPSDSMRRVDWKRYAKTGDLSTVEFREERAATVVVLVDARRVAYRGVDDDPHAVSYGVAAAEQLFVAALSERNRVGIAAVGREVGWFAPGAGRTHRVRGQEFLATHPAFGSHPPSSEPPLDDQVTSLRERLPTDAQVLVLSPLCDDDIVGAARAFEAQGHAVSVVSVDVTQSDTPGQRLASVERDNRVRRLRQSDIPVVEWDPANPLAATLASAQRRRA